MNLVQFLQEVDSRTTSMTKEQLQAYAHEIARILPEGKRLEFLSIMVGVQQSEQCDLPQSDKYYQELVSEIDVVKDRLISINNGEKCLDSEYNEEWDDWYNSDVDEVLFFDPQGLLQDIENAIDLLHKCVDMEAYEEGYELAEIMSVLEVFAVGDYNDYSGAPLGVRELYNHELIRGSIKKVILESLYLTYMGNSLSYRAEELYCMMENYKCHDVMLEDILQTGKRELPEFEEFLVLWMDYISCQSETNAKKLLLEAQMMLKNDDQILELTRKYADNHPELYKNLLLKGLASKNAEEMLQIGMEALNKIPVVYILRGEIALLTAEYANELQITEVAELCWLEAFRSDTSVINYMRIRFFSKKWKKYRLEEIYEDTYQKTRTKQTSTLEYYYKSEPGINSLAHEEYCMLLFLDGHYDKVIHLGLNATSALGWSSTFMKEGLALFLMLIYKSDCMTRGISAMIGRVKNSCGFQMDRFLQGTNSSVGCDEYEYFWKIFCKFKKSMGFTELECSKWLEMIEKYIAIRCKGIMENQRRNYYGECAAYIAELGEVKESRGILDAKSAIMEEYKRKYPRHSAFHRELRDLTVDKM